MKTIKLSDKILETTYGTADPTELVAILGAEGALAVIKQANFLSMAETLDSIVERLDRMENNES